MSNTNQLFSRDLKRFVDDEHVGRAADVRRRLTTLLVGTVVVSAVIVIGSLAVDLAPKRETTPRAGARPDGSTAVEAARPAAAARDDQVAATADASIPAEPDPTGNSAPPEDPAPDRSAARQREALQWTEYEIKRGDSLSKIFAKQSLSAGDALRIAAHEDAQVIKVLVPGRKMRIGRDGDDRLRALSFELRNHRSLNVAVGADGSLSFDVIEKEHQRQSRAVEVVIEGSLFKAASRAGLSDRAILELASIFGWEIDFASELQTGDRFTVLQEELVSGDDDRVDGNVLAVRYAAEGRELYAFRHVTPAGRVQYYDAAGLSLRGDFLRTPMKISRITSGFSKRRRHPISKEWKEHKGVDYAAPKGTPVLATGAGHVSFVGSKNGYGKTVVLKHAGGYSTLYAHLSRFTNKVRRGTRIEQGEIIGFVGRTGSATAPHLHYEFRVGGRHVDPLAYDLPRADPIPNGQRQAFLQRVQAMKAAMLGSDGIQLASNEAG